MSKQPQTVTEPEWLPAPEYGRMMNISTKDVQRLATNGVIAFKMEGKKKLYKVADSWRINPPPAHHINNK